ncbi:MarR family winged helix-turn-helix transcriptional regulator [Acidobacteria bacterium AH-259-O06]|nr:MarR family winged helix-turn-helix transcriptional regulator [Acidobacteria bacterium AH-259-O06]
MKHNERYLYYLYKKSKKETYKGEIGDLERVSPYLYYLYKRVLSPEQKEILEIIRGGAEITPREMAEKMEIEDVNYITKICKSMVEKDWVDVLVSGKVIITPKGERVLGRYPVYQLTKSIKRR